MLALLAARRALSSYTPCSLVFIVLTLCSGVVHAWSRAGHMVSAAIAYEELAARDKDVLRRLVEIMDAHPDKGSFQVAVDDAGGDERALRMLMEMARWPDDIRNSAYDHPTWHYAGRPFTDRREPPPKQPGNSVSGAALQAFALQAVIAADSRAPAAERAIAWCWIFHLVGDIHQPLHAADLYSRVFPDGDRGGSRFFVLDPHTKEPTSLHWYWDDAAHRSSEADSVVARARELRKKYPRSHFRTRGGAVAPAHFEQWARESYELAGSIGYRDDAPRSASAAEAKALGQNYIADSTATAEQRLTLAGYRLADLIRALL